MAKLIADDQHGAVEVIERGDRGLGDPVCAEPGPPLLELAEVFDGEPDVVESRAGLGELEPVVRVMMVKHEVDAAVWRGPQDPCGQVAVAMASP